jgi:Flp pilus assembly protein TadD
MLPPFACPLFFALLRKDSFMALDKRYRSLLAAGLSAASLLAGCNGAQTKPHATIKQEQVKRFNLAKLGVTLQLAQQQYAVGDYDKCRKTLAEAFALNEPHSGLEMLAAKVDIETGSLESALDHLKSAARMSPTDPEPLYLLGVVYQRWQKMDQAAAYYQQAWGLKSGEARYMLALVEMKISMGQLDEAQQLLEAKSAFFEQTAAVRIALARIAMLKKDYIAASKHYRDAYLLVSEDQGVKRSYAESLFYAGKFADAIPLLNDLRSQLKPQENGSDAQEIDADKTSLGLMLGNAYLNVHRVLDARTCFQDVAQLHPENPQAILGLGKVCAESNEYGAAIAAGKRVLRAEPRNVQAMILIAMVQQKQQKWADAFATLQTATGIAPKDSTLLCMQGVSALKMGRTAEATGYFEKAVAANPGDSWAVDLLARAKPAVASEVVPDAPAASEDAPERVTTAVPTKADETP